MALDRLSQITNSGISTTISFRSAGINVSGIVTASSFVGDGSGLTGVVGSGSGVIIKDDNATVGTASTINFGSNLSVSAISSGIVTVTGTDTNTTYTQAAVASGSNVNIRLSGSDSTTDDILLTAGSNVTFSSVNAAGFTINSSGSGGGSSSQFGETSSGIHTLSNVGIGTTNPTSKLTVSGTVNITGVVTATSFSGSGSGLTNIPSGQLTGALPVLDGSALTGVIASGSGVVIKDSGLLVGTAGTIDFGDNLTVSAISAGIVTVTGSAGSGASSQFVTTAVGIHTLSNVGIGTTNPTSKLQVERYGVSTGFGTFSATAGIATDIDTFAISSIDFKTVEYTLHFTNDSNIQAQKVLVMQNGTTSYSQEYGIMFEPNRIVSIGTTFSSGVCKLQATPESGISGLVIYRIVRQGLL